MSRGHPRGQAHHVRHEGYHLPPDKREIDPNPYHLPAQQGAWHTFIKPPWAVALSGGRSACPSVTSGRGGCTRAVEADFHGCWKCWLLPGVTGKVCLSDCSRDGSSRSVIAVFFQAAQLEAHRYRVECGLPVRSRPTQDAAVFEI